MNTQFKLIGFDLDGTLVNSLPDLALSVNSALTEFSLPQASEELVLTWIGNGAPVLIARALDWACAQSGRELTASEIEKVKARFNFYYGENLCNISHLYPNVKETLENLKEIARLIREERKPKKIRIGLNWKNLKESREMTFDI